jgi:hypothetical protein
MRRSLIRRKDFNISIEQGEQAEGGGVRVFFSEEEGGE